MMNWMLTSKMRVVGLLMTLTVGLAGLASCGGSGGGSGAGAGGGGVSAGGDLVAWRTLDQAATQPDRDTKPLLMDFTADWCGYCQQMKRDVFSREDVADYIHANYIPVVIDGTKMTGPVAELMQTYGVRGFPTFVIVSPSGQVISRSVGARPASDYLDWLKKHAQSKEAATLTDDPITHMARSGPTDPRRIVTPGE